MSIQLPMAFVFIEKLCEEKDQTCSTFLNHIINSAQIRYLFILSIYYPF
jgi:hypothetical protein